jgi:hypothetical protein
LLPHLHPMLVVVRPHRAELSEASRRRPEP